MLNDVVTEQELEDEDLPSLRTKTRQQSRADKRADEKLLRKSLRCFKEALEADEPQRKREKEDLEFDEGKQWPDELLTNRKERMDPFNANVKIPARPTLTIPRLDGPIQQVINAQSAAALAIQVKPKGSGATAKTAERINGLIRHIQVESRAQIARGWAYNRAVKVGRGYYRILKEYANDGDHDMDLVVSRILNQSAVYVDPNHIQPDASDMEWAHVIEDLGWRRFEREHPKSKIKTLDAGDLEDDMKPWVTFDEEGKHKTVRRAEYWYVTYTERLLITTEAGWTGFEEDRPDEDKSRIVRDRVVRQRNVRVIKHTATEILERGTWEGRYIPIIQVIGREYNVNGRRSFKGMVSTGKDAARSYNYMRSKQVEAVGLAPVAPYTMVEGQDEGYEDMWAQANVVPFARLLYKPVSIGGQPAPPPQRTSASTDIGAITIAAEAASHDVDAITGFSDPARGRSNPADRSGKMIQALQGRTDATVSDFMENLTNVSMVHEGRILVDMLPFVYDTEGRVATILDEDLKTSRQVLLNAPFIPGGPDDEPIPAPPGDPRAEIIDLKKGRYRVVVDVGKNWKTQRQEAVAMLSEVIAANPNTAPLLMDVLVSNIDAPGFDKLAKRFQVMLPPAVQKIEAGDSPLPPEAQAALAMKDQQLEQQGQQMAEMSKVIEQKQVEAQAKKDLEMMRLQQEHELKLAELAMKERLETQKMRLQAETDTRKLATDRANKELDAVERRIHQENDLRHEAISQDTQIAADRAQAELEAEVARETAAKKAKGQ